MWFWPASAKKKKRGKECPQACPRLPPRRRCCRPAAIKATPKAIKEGAPRARRKDEEGGARLGQTE